MSVALGIVKSTALYLFLSLLVCVWALDVPFADATSAAANPSSFADVFLLAGLWALPVLLLTVLIGAVSLRIRQARDPSYRSIGAVESLFGGIGYAFVNPFDGLRALVVNRRTNDLTGLPRVISKAFAIFHFSWAVALLLYLVIGFIAVP